MPVSTLLSRRSVYRSLAELELNWTDVTFVTSVPIHFFAPILTADVGGPLVALSMVVNRHASLYSL